MREGSTVLEILFLVFGMVMCLASLFNWKYFFGLRKAKMLVDAIGIRASRIVYAVLGLFFFGIGADALMGWGIFNF